MAQWRPGERAAWDEPGGQARPPLPELPCFPALRGWSRLRADLELLGLRHLADLLRPPAPTSAPAFGNAPVADDFRVLDGVWLRARGTRWRRIDEDQLQQARTDWLACGDARASGAADLLDILLVQVRHDPDGLRRLLLWQLACLLRDGSAGPTEEAAVALGVHRDEARCLAAAVALGFPAAGPGRVAAEQLADVWPDRRLCRAERTALAVRDTGHDRALTALFTEVRAHRAEVDRLITEAGRLAGRGAHRAAARAWFGALRRAVDDPDLEIGLLGAAADAAVSSSDGPRLRAEPDERTVRLTWPATRSTTTPLTFQLLRFPDGMPGLVTELAVGELPDQRHTDVDAPVGRPLRWALVPLREGQVAGVPLVSAPVVIAPGVRQVTSALVPEGIRLRWRTDDACTRVTAVRHTGGHGDPVPAPCERDGLLDVPLPPGPYAYEIHCHYPGPDGTPVRSTGVRVDVRAEEWPGQVRDLTARLLDGGERVALTWSPPSRGTSTVLPWPTGPVREGQDVSTRTDLPEPPSGPLAPEPSLEVPVPEGSRLRLTALSTLEGRALTGPDVIVERPCTVRNLTVHRLSDVRAAARFDWPEPAILVHLTWETDGHREERRVPRSQYLSEGQADFPVGPTSYRVTAAAHPRPDALTPPTDRAQTTLPALPPPTPLPPPPPPWTNWRRWWPFRR
ncbi:hypothetical protein [Streptomyces sp. NPDC087294]|uniref:hypothetical protein n=1 Tax=Streptomyces sp. NPDC087294 TaxID=3365777 RepID=UPI003823DC89